MKSKRKELILLSPNIYPCIIGGLELFNSNFAENLEKYFKIKVLTYCSLYYGNNKKIPSNNLILVNMWILSFLIKYNKKLIILPYTSNSSLIYPLLITNLLFGTNYLIIIHGGGMYPWKPFFLQKRFFLNAKEIIAVSKPIQNEYQKRLLKPIKFIPPLIPFQIEKKDKNQLKRFYKFNEKDKIIVSIGSLKKIKGNNILLEGFVKLTKNFIKKNSLKLLFIGEGPLKEELQFKTLQNDLCDHVIFMGNISHEKVKEFYKMADIYVIPSLFEGTPISLLEAMFNSLPILASNVTGINNIIINEKNGLLFTAEDSNDLASKLSILIKNPEKSTNYGRNARKDYNINYNYEKMIDKYKEIIRNIGESNE